MVSKSTVAELAEAPKGQKAGDERTVTSTGSVTEEKGSMTTGNGLVTTGNNPVAEKKETTALRGKKITTKC